jgi:hypothetical protein
MSELPAASHRWLADHHGVVTTAVLRAHGVGRSTVTRLVDAAVLGHVAKGVYVIASSPPTIEQRCAILSAAHPTGFVTGPTAGSLAGLRRMPRTTALHYSVRHGVHLDRIPGVAWRQTTVVRPADRRRRDDGITVASPARLAFDLAADLHQLDHLSVANQLLESRAVTVDELWAIDRRLGHPARPGSGVFRRTLTSLGSTSAPNESHPEVVLAEALRRLDVPIEHQANVHRPSNGRPMRIDLAVPDIRWGVELDIHPEHRSLEGHADDARRRREMHRAGWQIEVVTEHDMGDVDSLARDLAALYQIRRRQIAAHPSAS